MSAFDDSTSFTEDNTRGLGIAIVKSLYTVPVTNVNGFIGSLVVFIDKALEGKERTSFEVVGADPLGP